MFILHDIPDDISKYKDSGSEFDDLYTPELHSDSSFSDKFELDFSGRFNSGHCLTDRPPKPLRIPTRLKTIEAPQEMGNSDAEIHISYDEKVNEQNIELAPDNSQSKLPSPDDDR